MTPTLIIVGADKGGVGKTFVSRILLDYLKESGTFEKAKGAKVYDTEGALHRFYKYAEVIDIEKVANQAKIFDSVESAGLVVVDMKAGLLSATLRSMRNAGKLANVDAGKERIIIIHVLGSNLQSMNEIIDTNALIAEGGEHVIVENYVSEDESFFKWDEAARKTLFQLVDPKLHFDIPHLDTHTREDVDLKGLPFSAYVKNHAIEGKKHSPFLAGTVAHWRDQIYPNFAKMKVGG